MNLKERLTPVNTQEVRPGIFIQENSGKYRVIEPIAWQGEWRLRKHFSWKNLVTIVLIIFITWSYFNETSYCRSLQEDPCSLLSEINNYCFEKNKIDTGGVYEREGEYNFTIQNNS